ncbi:MAG: hypothetical protein LAP85_10615 [Acidobacteriia bacterium]|nr:hypothetical protein [Terriglobia bacterium]
MNENGMLKPALIGGVLLGIVSVIPGIQLCCCIWTIGGGILAAHLYVKSSPLAVTLGSGVGLGLLTGAIGGMVYCLFSISLGFLLSGGRMGMFEETRRNLSEIPNLPQWFREALATMPTQGSAIVVLMIFAALLTIAIFSLIGAGGGVIGVAVFEKRKIERPAQDYQPPPPPPAVPPLS